jgi:hypothetical protein
MNPSCATNICNKNALRKKLIQSTWASNILSIKCKISNSVSKLSFVKSINKEKTPILFNCDLAIHSFSTHSSNICFVLISKSVLMHEILKVRNDFLLNKNEKAYLARPMGKCLSMCQRERPGHFHS